MVSTPKSSSNNHSPTSAPSSAPSGDTNNPSFMRKTLPSPWAQVVRGGETESPTGIHQSLPSSSSSSSSSLTTGANDQAPSSDCSPKAVSTPPLVDNLITIASDVSDGNAGHSKKSVWNKPSNGVVETGPVMGAELWPALSESTKFSGKLPAESSPKTAAVDGSPSTSQGSVISHPPQRQGTSNTKFSSATIYNMQNRPRPVKRVAGVNVGPGPVQGNFSSPPTPPPLPPFPIYQLTPGSYGNMGPSISDSSSRYHYRNNNCDARPLVGDSSRRSNFGSHPRGNNFYHQNTYSKDRGNRDSHAPQQRMLPRGLLRHPPPGPAAFLGPQPIGPFPNQVAYPELYYFPTVTMDPFRGMPFFPHSPSPATFFPAAESPLSNMIVNQIDYYFSDTNLIKDEFLRSNMDEEGWVPITLIANFPRVRNLTSNVQLILDSLRGSTVVDVHDDKLRRRNDWMNWLPSSQVKIESSSVSSGSRYSNLTDDFQTITLEKTTREDEGESSRQSPLSNGSEDAGNVN